MIYLGRINKSARVLVLESYFRNMNQTIHKLSIGILTNGETFLKYVSNLKPALLKQSKSLIGQGYASFITWYNDAARLYARSTQSKGVCASVRIQINQKLTLTREAFLATLKLKNEGNDFLSNISVTLTITSLSENNNNYSCG